MSRKSPRSPSKILIANPFGIGDVIFSMTLVEALKTHFPSAAIGFLCNERTAPLVAMNASIESHFIFNRGRLRDLWPLFFLIKKERFDCFFDLSLGRSFGFFAMCLGIPARIGFDYKDRGIFLTHKTKIAGYEGAPVARLQLGLLRYLGLEAPHEISRLPIKISDAAREKAAGMLRQKGISQTERILCVAPGGGKSWGPNAIFKQWAPERFAQAVEEFIRSHPHKVVWLGDQSEAELLDAAAHRLEKLPLCLAGESFDVVCAMLQRSDLLLCNDGGLLHLAHALGVKTVSIFGPVDEKVYGPYGNLTPHAVAVEPVPCRPCYQKFHFPPCPYNRRCLEDLGVEKVLAMMEKIA